MEDVLDCNLDDFIDFDVAAINSSAAEPFHAPLSYAENADFSQWSTSNSDADLEALFPQCSPLFPPLTEDNSIPLVPELSSHEALSSSNDLVFSFSPHCLPSRPAPHSNHPSPLQNPSEPSWALPLAYNNSATTHSSASLARHQGRQLEASSRPHARTYSQHRHQRSKTAAQYHELQSRVASGDLSDEQKARLKLSKSLVLATASEQITELSNCVTLQQKRIDDLNQHIQSSKVLLESICETGQRQVGGSTPQHDRQEQQSRVGAVAPMLDDGDEMSWIP